MKRVGQQYMDKRKKYIKENLNYFKRKLNYGNQKLARFAQLSGSSVELILKENGNAENPTIFKLFRLSRFFNLSLDDFVFKNVSVEEYDNLVTDSMPLLIDKMYIKENLKYLMKLRELTQIATEELVDGYKNMIKSIVHGYCNPKLNNVIKLAKFFNVSLEEFVATDLSK